MTLAVRDFPTLLPKVLLRGGRSALAGSAEDETISRAKPVGSRVAGG
jgi:hypothetical protein